MSICTGMVIEISNEHNVPVGHSLTYISEKGESMSSYSEYEEGTPFCVHRGTLVMKKKKRSSLGFINEETHRGTAWPLR